MKKLMILPNLLLFIDINHLFCLTWIIKRIPMLLVRICFARILKNSELKANYMKNIILIAMKFWFHRLSLKREEIVLINRIYSNNYSNNLNYSLHQKNFVNSCPCDPRQDINHVVFFIVRCLLLNQAF